MKRTLYLALIISLFLITACSLSDEDIINKVKETNSNLNSYITNTNSKVDMKMGIMGMEMTLNVKANSVTEVDNANKKMHSKVNLKEKSNLGASKKEDELIEVYLTDGDAYTKIFGQWVKNKAKEDLWKYDDAKTTFDLLKDSGFERLEDEKEHYVLKVKPDLKKVYEKLSKTFEGQGLDNKESNLELPEDIKYGDVIKEYSLTVWINKKSFVIEKIKENAKMVMSSEFNKKINEQSKNDDEELPGVLENVLSDMSMELNIESETTISDVNKELKIELPEEAKNAASIEESSWNIGALEDKTDETNSVPIPEPKKNLKLQGFRIGLAKEEECIKNDKPFVVGDIICLMPMVAGFERDIDNTYWTNMEYSIDGPAGRVGSGGDKREVEHEINTNSLNSIYYFTVNTAGWEEGDYIVSMNVWDMISSDLLGISGTFKLRY